LAARSCRVSEVTAAAGAVEMDKPSSRDLAAHHRIRDSVNREARQELAARGRGLALCKFWSSGAPSESCREGDLCSFRHFYESAEEEARAAAKRAAKQCSREISKQELVAYEEVGEDQAIHGDKQSKKLRAACFALWLIQQYGREALSAGAGVLDVAGGQGDLSWSLSVDFGIPCTLVDPGLRRGGQLKSWQRRALRKSGNAGFAHLPVEFSEKYFGPTADALPAEAAELPPPPPSPHAELLRTASIVVGLHPDEATEFIVDLALACSRRFAVVPCCVFASKFSDRQLSSGVPVRTLNQFCSYLQAKDDRIQTAFLGFEGRNKVLHMP